MKITWGHSITIVFISFAIFILYMVTEAYKQDVNLVSEDYYAKEINYQEQMNKMNNASDIEDKISISQDENYIVITGPATIKGEVTFFRPSDEKKDLTKKLSLSSKNEQHFNKKEFQRGLYKVQMDWEQSGKKYFVEKNIFVQ